MRTHARDTCNLHLKILPALALQIGSGPISWIPMWSNIGQGSYRKVFEISNRSEWDHLLQFPTNGGKGTVINRRLPIAMNDKVGDVLRAQRWTLRIVITVDSVVFVRVQRRDAYCRNDPSFFMFEVDSQAPRRAVQCLLAYKLIHHSGWSAKPTRWSTQT